MKLKRMLGRLEEFLNAEERHRGAEKKQMRRILRKLKVKEQKLAAEVAEERDDEARAAMAVKLKVVHAQRRKGLAALKAMKKGTSLGA